MSTIREERAETFCGGGERRKETKRMEATKGTRRRGVKRKPKLCKGTEIGEKGSSKQRRLCRKKGSMNTTEK